MMSKDGYFAWSLRSKLLNLALPLRKIWNEEGIIELWE
jgi:hypothetical protein